MAKKAPGPKPIWATPAQLLKDFELFLEYQAPHRKTVLKNVRHLKKGREHIKNPRSSDYEYGIEEVETLSEQGVISIIQFARWKGCHRTTINTGYSEGAFQDAYLKIKGICEAYEEEQLHHADRNVTGIIFALKNAYGWIDRTETELSGSINTPLSDEAKAILAKATRSDDGIAKT